MTPDPTTLVMAGAREAQSLVTALKGRGRRVIACLPEPGRMFATLPVPTRTGGFGSPDEMGAWLADHNVRTVIDASHGFDDDISALTGRVAAARGLRYLRVLRPGWTATPRDIWQQFGSVAAAAEAVPVRGRAFSNTGWLTLRDYAGYRGDRLYMRQTHDAVKPAPYPFVKFVEGHPPFTQFQEQALFERLRVTHLICRQCRWGRQHVETAGGTGLAPAGAYGGACASGAGVACGGNGRRSPRLGGGRMSAGRIIRCDADVSEGAAWLACQCPRMAYALGHTGPLPLRRKGDGFDALLSAIVSQQVSVASARAIWSRMETAGMTRPDRIARASWDDLRALGLSRQKIRYAQALADAGIDYEALRHQTDADVVKTLVAVPGIGAWTAEIYAMFSLGRADVFAPGDLALQEAARSLYALPQRPREAALRQMAQAWSPWRSVAARLLFAYYNVCTRR